MKRILVVVDCFKCFYAFFLILNLVVVFFSYITTFSLGFRVACVSTSIFFLFSVECLFDAIHPGKKYHVFFFKEFFSSNAFSFSFFFFFYSRRTAAKVQMHHLLLHLGLRPFRGHDFFCSSGG